MTNSRKKNVTLSFFIKEMSESNRCKLSGLRYDYQPHWELSAGSECVQGIGDSKNRYDGHFVAEGMTQIPVGSVCEFSGIHPDVRDFADSILAVAKTQEDICNNCMRVSKEMFFES